MISIPSTRMWNFASSCFAGNVGLKKDTVKVHHANLEGSEDDASSEASRDEGLECPICWESFNIVENVPYVLWCGHTLCKNCILGLQWAVVKFPTLPIQLPLFISCPWCNLLSFRLVLRGNLKFPRKNYFLLWMVERMNGDRRKSHAALVNDHETTWPSGSHRREHHHGHHDPDDHHDYHTQPSGSIRNQNGMSYIRMDRLQSSIKKSLIFFVHLTAKFPLVIIFLLIVLYAIPTSAAILALYVLITVLFALPSFLILYFAYPSLDWLVREIAT